MRREAFLHLTARDVTANHSIRTGELRAHRSDLIERPALGRHRSFDGLKGNLRIFYNDCSHVRAVLAVLRAARTARRRGVDIVVGHMSLHRAPPRHVKRAQDLMAQFECLPLEPSTDRESEIDFELAAALRRRPAIIVTGRLVSGNAGECGENAALYRWYVRIEKLLESGIDVWTAVYDNIRPGRLTRKSAG